MSNPSIITCDIPADFPGVTPAKVRCQWAAIWIGPAPPATIELALKQSRAEALKRAQQLREMESHRGGLTFIARVYPPGDAGTATVASTLLRCARLAGTTSSSPDPTRPRSSSSRSAKRRARRERKRSSCSKPS